MPTIRDVVQALSRRPGVQAAIVLGRDGLPIDSSVRDGVDVEGVAALVPPVVAACGALGLPAEPGVLLTDQAFDALTSAPLEGYVTDSALVVAANTVFVVRSRSSTVQCALAGGLPRYGKFHVLNVDLAARTVTLEMLVDLNCGYRGLEPGTPEA